jgi:hypothetical protein
MGYDDDDDDDDDDNFCSIEIYSSAMQHISRPERCNRNPVASKIFHFFLFV